MHTSEICRTPIPPSSNRFGTEAGRKRTHPTHSDIDDINEAKKRCKTNALWGVELKPGKPFTLNFEKERGRLNVSQATLSTGSTSMTSIVQCQVGDKKAICICSLLPEKQERCLLNLEFEEDHEDITFLVIGSHSVHLSGFFYGESEDCFGDEYASDPYEEGAAEIDSESSDSIKFEDVAEDGDKDGSTDDAFKILEEEEPRDESGTLKRPKKKKHHLNVTDEEENLIVIKGNTDSPLSESEDEDGFSLHESKSKSATSKKSDGIEDEDTHEEALNEKARGTDVDERKGLQRIVCEDTSKTYDYQSRGEQIKQKKVMDGEELDGAHPEHVEANNEPIDDDFSMYLPSPVPNSGGFKKALLDPRLLEAERLKKKSSPSTDEEKKEMSLVPYSYAVGSLMYSMVCTRPDIARYC
ncbi:Peptidyl-prolyl cis-trans isomerase FKBP53 [Capsicum baccatum]|uniref:peptidylprolyl isomerase n=1 Tax=Capsicum baccatum TaxID=33114 RepID=A0A2G2V3I6_CAPBA|nr:Peptidyl-prolyl cis-trans isomerase FKBP53 [Capsicum baccatum]